MLQEIEKYVKQIKDALCSCDGLECLSWLCYSEDTADPQFVLAFDAYTHKEISKVTRRELFSFTSLFESSRMSAKDRFFIDEIPIHIDYKFCKTINQELKSVSSTVPRYKSLSTYSLWRITFARIVFEQSNWFSAIQKDLTNLPDSFWNRQERALRATIEHSMMDINAAVFTGDNLVFYLATAQVIRYICRILHVRAKSFDPTERILYKSLRELHSVSQELINRIDILLEPTAALTQNQRVELLNLIVKDVI